MMAIMSLLVAFLAMLEAGVGFAAELQSDGGVRVNNPPGTVYWGCSYPINVSGGDLTDVTISLIDGGGKVISQLFQDIHALSGGNEWVPLPGMVPVGNNYRLSIKDSTTSSMSNPFNLVAKETPPSSCAAPQYSTASFSVPSTSASSKASSTSSSTAASSSSLVSTSPPPTSSTSSVPSTSSATSSLSSSEAPTQSMPSMSTTMAISVPTATPTTNGGNGAVSCRDVDPRVPVEWKCAQGSNCISIDDASSAICCSDHTANCTTIFALDCNIQEQNAATNPGSQIFTTWLDQKLPSCGEKCCPFGYYCHHSADEVDWHCLMATYSSSINKTADELVRQPKASAPPAANATSTDMFMPPAIATLLPGGAAQPGDSGGNATSSGNKALTTGSIAGIAVGSVAGIAVIAAAAVWILRRRKKQDNSDSGDLDIKPYQYSTPQPNGGAVSSGPPGSGMNQDTGYHFEKDGQPIQSSTMSPTIEKDGEPIQSPIQSPMQSPRPGQNHTVYEMA